MDPRLTALPAVYHHEAVDDACAADLSWAGGLLAWVAGELLPWDKTRAMHAALAAAPTWVGLFRVWSLGRGICGGWGVDALLDVVE